MFFVHDLEIFENSDLQEMIFGFFFYFLDKQLILGTHLYLQEGSQFYNFDQNIVRGYLTHI